MHECRALLLEALSIQGVTEHAFEKSWADLSLDQVIGGTSLNSRLINLAVARAGEQDQRRWTAEGQGLPDKLQAVALAQSIVQQTDVVRVAGNCRDAGLVRCDRCKLIPGRVDIVEQGSREEAIIRIVVDEEDSDRRHASAVRLRLQQAVRRFRTSTARASS